jgi:tol-pal system protein YbgF
MVRHSGAVRAIGVAAALLAVSLFASCAATDREIAQQGGRLDDLQARVLRLERSVAEGRSARPEQAIPPDLGARLADLRQQVESLTVEVRTVGGRVDSLEAQGRKRTNESSRLPELEAKLSALAEKMKTLEGRAASTAGQPAGQAKIPAGPAPQPGSVPKPPEQKPPESKPSSDAKQSPQVLYDAAYALYKQGKYDEARESFQEFTRQFPDSNLADNAYFWVGESYYDQGQYEQAILEYDKVVQKFPNGDKAASALLKQAFAFDAINDPVDAKILLKKILREHPSSEQAAIAKKKLEMIGD